MAKYSHQEFKEKARQHQINFKTSKEGLNIPLTQCYIRRYTDRQGNFQNQHVESSLDKSDVFDKDNNYIIFYEGFRKEISYEINSREFSPYSQMVTNLLRSEHIPYNLFFPMKLDIEAAKNLFNEILGKNRIAKITDIIIEHNPVKIKGENGKEDIYHLEDGTAFDTYIEYLTPKGLKGGIGIEVKYTEGSYPLKKDSKEYKETHDEATGNFHLANNYREPSFNSGWFKSEFIEDLSDLKSDKAKEHVVANKYRQIWRNHLLGASMVLNNDLDEFTSLTVYPEGNGHFDNELWDGYENKLTPEGQKTLRHITYEELFPLIEKYFKGGSIQKAENWVTYLKKRYLVE